MSLLRGILILAVLAPVACPQSVGSDPSDTRNLRGIWEAQGSANWSIEGHPAQQGMPAAKSIIVDPANGKIPYLDAAAKKRQELLRTPEADPQAKCFMAGVPRATYAPGPLQIFQSPDNVTIVYQDSHSFRLILTDGRPHIDGVDFWMGDSRGRWEGDTLVIDVTALNDQTWFDHAGTFHTENLHVVERYKRTASDTLQYEATMDDPAVFSRPWTIRIALKRHKDPAFRIVEDACYEDHRGPLYRSAVRLRK